MSSRRATLRRWRFSIGILGPVVVCLVLTTVATLATILWSARGVDDRSLARQNDLARQVIALQLSRIPHDQESVTIWDDSITHTKLSFDLAWIDANLGLWMHDFFGHDEVIILDDKDRPIYDMDGGKRSVIDHAEAQMPDLHEIVSELRRKVAGGGLDAYAAGKASTPPRASDLLVVGGVPSLVSVAPIISDSGAIKQSRGTEYLHISIIHLDDAFAKRLADEYFIKEPRFTRLGTVSSDETMLPLTNSAGRFITFFDWKRDDPGKAMVDQTLPVILGAFAVAGLIAVFLLDRLWRQARALEAGRADAERQASHDPLTTLLNRAGFESALARALTQRPVRDRRYSVLMLDLDRFKQVNDTLGHSAGDDLIQAVGQRLAQLLAPGDVLARLGGDEFAILHAHRPGLGEALQLSQHIIDAIGKPFDVFGSEAFVGVSIGIATADGNEAEPRELIRKADIALYEAKTSGRNRAVVFEESMSELLQNRHTIEAELRDALRRTDQVWVEYQPLFSAQRDIIGAEALARWRHPRLGQVSPAHFIPVAEATGLIGQLGDFVLERACTASARWPGRSLAVNISPAQLRDVRFPERVFAILRATGMRPADLEFEITEGILLEDAGTSTEALHTFRAAGIRIALDDFGTGYSSLNYLKRYPVDRIKVDRSFVSQLDKGGSSVAIVEAMVTLAHALKIEVTAEGVETQTQMDVLRRLGCNAYQGFLLSPPVSVDAFETLLLEHAQRSAVA